MSAFALRRLFVIGILCVAFGALTVDSEAWDFSRVPSSVINVFGGGVCEKEKLCVVFFDVGQGDATFIQTPSGFQTLIDGGADSMVLKQLSKEIGFFDKDIDLVIATHPDSDHVGGLIDVFMRYKINTVIRTNNKHNTPVTNTLDDLIDGEGANVLIARSGQVYDLGDGVMLEVLFPDRDMTEAESNTASIVVRLTYGKNSFIFTGDSPKNIEEYLVFVLGNRLKSDVLKVGHHGSRTSTSELFLDTVRPEYAVISAGKNNQYGHPNVEVTDALFNRHIDTKNTAEMGSIYIQSDGVKLYLE